MTRTWSAAVPAALVVVGSTVPAAAAAPDRGRYWAASPVVGSEVPGSTCPAGTGLTATPSGRPGCAR